MQNNRENNNSLFGNDVPVGTIKPHLAQNALVAISGETTLRAALQVMKANRILSLPVEKMQIDKDDGKLYQQIMGVVDTVQILAYIAYFCGSVKKEDAVKEMENKLDIPMKDLVGMYSKEGTRVWRYDSSTPLSIVIRHMSSGVHRCLITTNVNVVCNIISQRDVISFVLKHLNKIPRDLADSTVQALKMVNPQERKVGHCTVAKPELVSAPKDMLLVDCLRMMEREEITAIPLLDDDGLLYGTLSASDLRGVDAEDLCSCLFQPASHFVKTQRTAVVARPSVTFVDLLKLIEVHHVHRVWIVDDSNKPIGVVSLSDIMNKLK